jgi:D-glycero-alpha-D-manno-heptose 1-phosphate guanylyltransferase
LKEAIVLAGGFGTRLGQAIRDVPKPMAPIRGRPFLEFLLGLLDARGMQRAVLALGYKAELIRRHFGAAFRGLQLDYVVEEQPLGTGGAVRLAMAQCREDHVFVFNGDTYLDLEIPAVEQHWQRNRAPIIVGREVPCTARFGRLQVDQGRVTGFLEKGASGPGVINGGCCVLNRGQLDGFALNAPFSLETGYLAQAVARERFDLFMTQGQFIDIGTPEDLARAQLELA